MKSPIPLLLSRIKLWFEPPQFPSDDGKTRRAAVLHQLALFHVFGIAASASLLVPFLVVHRLENAAILLVPTQNGSVYAIGPQGQVRWSGALNAGSDLREPNVFTTPGSAFSLAYLGSSLGKLYAVIVDGRLDAAAPWPRAFHDPANTSSAAAPQP